jgi:hypothetical protein
MYDLLKSNWLLILLVPLNLIAGTYLVSWSGKDSISELIPLLLISTFEIGFVRECVVRNTHPSKRIRSRSIQLALLIFTALFIGIICSFQYKLGIDVILLFVTSLLLNEVKSYYDGSKRYDLGFIFRICSSLILPFVVILDLSYILYIMLPIAMFYLNKTMKIVSQFQPDESNDLYSRFSIINLLAIVGGNFEKMVLGYFMMDTAWVSSFLFFGEYNRRLKGMFGFLSPVFLFGHITKYLHVLILSLIGMILSVIMILLYFDLNQDYLLFSCSTIAAVMSQYLIYINLRKKVQNSSAYFSIIGILVLGLGLVFMSIFGILSFNGLVVLLVAKAIAEALYVIKL